MISLPFFYPRNCRALQGIHLTGAWGSLFECVRGKFVIACGVENCLRIARKHRNGTGFRSLYSGCGSCHDMVSAVPIGLFGGVDLVGIIGYLFSDRHVGVSVHNGRGTGVGFAVVPVGDPAIANSYGAGGGHGHDLDRANVDGDIHLAHVPLHLL